MWSRGKHSPKTPGMNALDFKAVYESVCFNVHVSSRRNILEVCLEYPNYILSGSHMQM